MGPYAMLRKRYAIANPKISVKLKNRPMPPETRKALLMTDFSFSEQD